MKWTCKKVQLYFSDYSDDDLSVQDRFSYEAHLAGCPACRDYCEKMSAFTELVRKLPLPPPEPAGIPQDVMNRFQHLSDRDRAKLADMVCMDQEEKEKAAKRREAIKKRRRREERRLPN